MFSLTLGNWYNYRIINRYYITGFYVQLTGFDIIQILCEVAHNYEIY